MMKKTPTLRADRRGRLSYNADQWLASRVGQASRPVQAFFRSLLGPMRNHCGSLDAAVKPQLAIRTAKAMSLSSCWIGREFVETRI